jgi:uncharacterized membrane protein
MKRGIVAGSIIIIILSLIALSVSVWVFHNNSIYLETGQPTSPRLIEQFGFGLFMLIFGIIMIIIGFTLLIGGFVTKPKINVGTTEQSKEDEVTKALNLRYAKGEITREQFEQMKKDLGK